MTWTSIFDRHFDTVVFGSGYSGWAAAHAHRRLGHDVLLVGATGDALWESGRAFSTRTGTSDAPAWRALLDAIREAGGEDHSVLDGAISEIVGTRLLRDADVEVLYYVRPIEVERDISGDVVSVIVAAGSGRHRLSASRWVDATEEASLLRLLDATLVVPEPSKREATALMQHPAWPASLVGASPSVWETERAVVATAAPHEEWTDRLDRAIDDICAKLGGDVARVCVSHMSVLPFPVYEQRVELPMSIGNLFNAVPAAFGAVTLADRFVVGESSAARVADPLSRISDADAPDIEELSADVVVVGVGTGGTLAAVAAARSGATVLGVDALPLVGGVGTAAGVHAYWFGAPGGMQAELDEATHQRMGAHGRGPYRDGPFNPWAKRRAVEAAIADARVALQLEAIVFEVERDGERVTAVLAATPRGIVRIQGVVFVDGSGDGDLCALAGAAFQQGRAGDGLLHAYSQSSGRLREIRGEVRMDVVNFDAGYVDPTDVQDLTRARVEGILLYDVGSYSNLERPTYIAPALGVRQGRQIQTDVELSLDDLVRRRRFPDVIGYTASHVDSHGTDFEFDSDEAVFWHWLNRAWGVAVACELSYRMILPRGISNIVIGSRCLGVSQDAHYAVRMQRDMQRIGEVAGRAAAISLAVGGELRRISVPHLQAQLEESRALGHPPRVMERGFGVAHSTEDAPAEWGTFDLASVGDDADRVMLLERALVDLDAGVPGEAIWWLYKNPEIARQPVHDRLDDPKSTVSWLAAGVAAMWRDPDAQARLVAAIDQEEYGFGVESSDLPPRTGNYVPRDAEPLTWHKLAPNWLTAIALIRRCGDRNAIHHLEAFVGRARAAGLSTVTALLLTLEELVRRGVATGEDARIRALIHSIRSLPMLGVVDYTSRASGYYAESARRGQMQVADWADHSGLDGAPAEQLRRMYVDMAWQPLLVERRIRRLLGDELTATPHEVDHRAYVRAAFLEVN